MRTKFELTILGNTSPFPAKGRLPTSQVLNINERLYLIDCGEGTQIRMDELGVRRMRIDRIFISHLHGDHYFGLFGLLGSYRVLRRQTPLHIHCPEGLQEMIELEARLSQAGEYPFPLYFHVNNPKRSEPIADNKDITVHTIPLNHRIPTTGFLFREKPLPRNILKSAIKTYDIPYQVINDIKNGANFKLPNGKTIPNKQLTTPPPPPRSYAFCSDTAYHVPIVPIIKEVDLLYHEATFDEADGDQAAKKGHSSSIDAAKIARKAKVKRLLLGHFSSRYNNLEHLAEEASRLFPNTAIAEERKTFVVE